MFSRNDGSAVVAVENINKKQAKVVMIQHRRKWLVLAYTHDVVGYY